ncbi:MAG: hypothetical protein V1915_00525 [Candidatus Bathyarchaeota archaeon]
MVSNVPEVKVKDQMKSSGKPEGKCKQANVSPRAAAYVPHRVSEMLQLMWSIEQ